jgi:SAM-dependent methyltransferase
MTNWSGIWTESRVLRLLARTSQMVEASRAALRGERPPRYDGYPFTSHLYRAIAPHVVPGAAILDVGSGATPTLRAEWRPPGGEYVGMDVSRTELERAAPGAYDRTVVADAAAPLPELEGRFDLIVSLYVFEHVKPLDAAVSNLRSYLKPGGVLVSQFSGAFAFFSLLNRALPERAKERLVERLTGRPTDDVFPARYHLCWERALRRRVFAGWSEVEVEPLYLGAEYLRFSRLLSAAYMGYEEWAAAGGHANLATHYVVSARR